MKWQAKLKKLPGSEIKWEKEVNHVLYEKYI